jgi:hypothetical protein
MSSLFYTTTNSIDEHSYNDREIYSIRDPNYIDQNDKNLFDVFPENLIGQTKEKDNISIEELLKIFSNNNLIVDNPVSIRSSPLFLIQSEKKRGRQTEKSKKSPHLSTDFDNLQRKIQVHFLTFIIYQTMQ